MMKKTVWQVEIWDGLWDAYSLEYKHCFSSLALSVDFPDGASGEEPTCQCRRYKREHKLDPWIGKIPRGGHGNLLQCSCLKNPLDREAWQATVHGVTKGSIILKASLVFPTHSINWPYLTWTYTVNTIPSAPLYPPLTRETDPGFTSVEGLWCFFG